MQIDVVKTRLMTQTNAISISTSSLSSSANKINHNDYIYNGTLDAFSKIYRREGLRSFFAGVLPRIA